MLPNDSAPRTHEDWRAWADILVSRARHDELIDTLADMGQQVTFLHDVRTYLLAALESVTSPKNDDYEPGDEADADALVSTRHLLRLAGLADHA